MPYDPYALAFPAPSFTLTSRDVTDGAPLPDTAYAEGGNTAPDLEWAGVPAGTQSLVVTAYDADAPIPGGLWHWVVKDVPATVPGLTAGVDLPDGAVALRNDLGQCAYAGAQPPPGTGTHRMFLTATALDVPVLDLPEDASTALLHILMIPHILGRAILIGTAEPRG